MLTVYADLSQKIDYVRMNNHIASMLERHISAGLYEDPTESSSRLTSKNTKVWLCICPDELINDSQLVADIRVISYKNANGKVRSNFKNQITMKLQNQKQKQCSSFTFYSSGNKVRINGFKRLEDAVSTLEKILLCLDVSGSTSCYGVKSNTRVASSKIVLQNSIFYISPPIQLSSLADALESENNPTWDVMYNREVGTALTVRSSGCGRKFTAMITTKGSVTISSVKSDDETAIAFHDISSVIRDICGRSAGVGQGPEPAQERASFS